MDNEKYFYIFIIVFVATIAAYTFYLVGSPMKARLMKFDSEKINDLQRISFEVEKYYRDNHELPKSLEELGLQPSKSILLDPKTNEKYRYEILSEKEYKLCADFSFSSQQVGSLNYRRAPAPLPHRSYDWSHPQGKFCFKRDVQNVKLQKDEKTTSTLKQ